MKLFSTKELYMEACHKSKDLHIIKDDELVRLQAHLRRMYVEIEKVCDRHGLKMMLAFGSVLGAVRHQGFIPWDDDIDLFMPRADYDRLINLYSDELPSEYKIFAPNSKNGPIYRFAKVVDTSTRLLFSSNDDGSEKNGIFVDIFPLENAPQGLPKIKWQQFKACFLMYVATSVSDYENDSKDKKKLMCSSPVGMFNYYFRYGLGFLFSWRDSTFWYDVFDRAVSRYPESCGYDVPSNGPSNHNYRPLAQDLFLPVKRVKFDDIEAYIPNKAEEYLTYEFGDWHRVPPENERWMHFISKVRYNVR